MNCNKIDYNDKQTLIEKIILLEKEIKELKENFKFQMNNFMEENHDLNERLEIVEKALKFQKSLEIKNTHFSDFPKSFKLKEEEEERKIMFENNSKIENSDIKKFEKLLNKIKETNTEIYSKNKSLKMIPVLELDDNQLKSFELFLQKNNARSIRFMQMGNKKREFIYDELGKRNTNSKKEYKFSNAKGIGIDGNSFELDNEGNK